MDSTKVEIVSHSIDKLIKEFSTPKTTSIWDTLTPILIGAGLTLLAQLAIELWKARKEKKNRKQELISTGRAKIYLIAQILKDLAMYKAHKPYYYRSFELSQDKEEKTDSFKKHYEKGQEQRLVKTKLDNSIAEYFQLVTEYSIITKNKDHFEEYFKLIFTYEHPKASGFEEITEQSNLRPHLLSEEKWLNEEYQILIDLFEAVQNSLL